MDGRCHSGRLTARAASLAWLCLASACLAQADQPRAHTSVRIGAEDLSEVSIDRPISAGIPCAGVRVSREIERADGFDQAVLSWNVRAPSGTAVGFELRAAIASGGWSAWVSMGQYVPGARWSESGMHGRSLADAFPSGRIERVRVPGRDGDASGMISASADVDSFIADGLFSRAQVRVSVPVACEGAAVEAERTWREIVVSDLRVILTNSRRMARVGSPVETQSLPRGTRALSVPFLSQRTPHPGLSGRLCSPTSVAMVMRYLGSSAEVFQVAGVAHDHVHDLFGNWSNNVQAAFELGVSARVERFNDWRQVERTLDSGQPLVVSITVREGELRNAPYGLTGGHLIVITGIDDSGMVRVNDPAVSNPAEGARLYHPEDLTNVWLRRKMGTAYILSRPESEGP